MIVLSFLAEYLLSLRVPSNDVCLGISTGIIDCCRLGQPSNKSAQTSPLQGRPMRSRLERESSCTGRTGHARQVGTKRLVGNQRSLPKIECTSRTLSLNSVEVALYLGRCHPQVVAKLPTLDLPLGGERYARNLLASSLIEALGVLGVSLQRLLQTTFSSSIEDGQRTIMMGC